MKHSKFDAWSKNKLMTEFAKANAEIAGILPRNYDAYQRKQEIAALLIAQQKYSPPEP